MFFFKLYEKQYPSNLEKTSALLWYIWSLLPRSTCSTLVHRLDAETAEQADV